MEYSSSGSRPCEQLLLSRRLSKFFKMNWTEGTLYRHSRGKLRKANVEKQRQKEYFAKTHIRAAEQREAMKNGPPPISYLQSNPALPETPPNTLHPDNPSSHGASHWRGIWGASVPIAENPSKFEHLLPTVDQFLKEEVGKATSTDTAPPRSHTNANVVERLRQRLLASKDWGASWIRSSVQVNKQPQVVPEHAPTAQSMRATEKPVHIPQRNPSLCPRKNTSRSRSLRRTDVQIRVGSQEKRLRESSTLDSEGFAYTRQNAPPERSRQFTRGPSECEPEDIPPRKRARRQPSLNAEDYLSRQRAPRCTDSNDTHHIVTSIPNVSHPVPRRAIPGHLLLSSETLDSANIASHVAQVGRAISLVSPSQKAENSVWKAWLEEFSSALGAQANSEPHEPVVQPRISPGVSERHESRHKQSSPPAQARRSRNSHITLPEAQLSGPDARSNVLAQFDKPVNNVGHSTPSTHRRFSVLLETPSNDAETPLNNGGWRQTAIFNQPVSVPRKPTSGLHQRGPIDAWKTFVFGDDDSEEVERDAFSEARHDAASKIRPFDENSLPSIRDEDHSGHDSNIAMAGTSSPANVELLKPSGEEFVNEDTTQTRKAQEPTSMKSQPISVSAEDRVLGPWYTPLANSQSSVAVEPLCVDASPINESETTENKITAMSDASGESPSVAASVTTSVDASLIVEPAKSRFGAPDSEEQSRFAPPRPFVGKHSIPARNDRPSAAIAPVTLRRKRGRPRKRTHDGRADIRALPNYSGDPIEEIEDEGVLPPSLFGSLDVCYDQ